ncbi:MAG: discoidin domain-containing protein, partial [Candidatus Kaiserbacteria bacterium]|nr:discoidin domain-containing protein [Candidatus Kaiserbacteria bacterium]
LKPDDYGEDTISLHVATNDAYLCANVTLTSNNENGCTEPEEAVDSSCDDPGADEGELARLVHFIWWADDGDNVFENDEAIITRGSFAQLGVGNTYSIALADSDQNIWTGTGGPVPGNETLHVAKAWCFGAIGEAALPQADYDSPADDNDNVDGPGQPEDGGFTCDGTALGNESQTDSLTADISFQAIQARHNDGFQCENYTPQTTLTLVKEVLYDGYNANEWTLFADGNTSFFGVAGSGDVTNISIEPGSYDLSEDGPNGLTASNWSCIGGTQNDEDTVTIAAGQHVTCTITNYVACAPDFAFADVVVDYDQGERKNGDAIATDRSDPSKALGMHQSNGDPFDSPVPSGEFFSLGFDEGDGDGTPDEGGWITVEFEDHYIVDGPGNDLIMWEVTGGSSYPVEKVKIEVSQDNSTWFEVESSLDRDAEADLLSSGLTWARYVRLTDVSDPAEFKNDADGYDLDAFSALNCLDGTVFNP